MASTYSNLKIQLMATGENSGTWGTVTNTNLGTALEQAITGSANVAVNADTSITLTDTNGAQDARALRLNLSGAGGFNLTVPDIQKLYLVNNGSLGTVTVKNSTGSTIAVPTSKTMWVFSTGTGVVDAVTHLSSLTLGSALPIASGGTGSTSTTYANLQSNVTGTLPIANGGTGSTSTTYANLQSNVTGTLPVANGGTGAVTLTSEAVIVGNTTSAVKFVSPGANGNILTSNGTAWTSAAPAAQGFDAGTVMIFAQTSAPTGWTKDTTNYNNHALRVVTGTASTGGTVDFTTAFASKAVTGTVGTSGATTLSTSEIPSHTHTLGIYLGAEGGNTPRVFNDGFGAVTNLTSNSTGGGGSHTHSGGTFTGTAINLAVKYLDVITATKN